jgi:hypothetical protein
MVPQNRLLIIRLLEARKRILDFDLNLYTTGEFELHQSVYGLSGRAVDVNQTLVV